MDRIRVLLADGSHSLVATLGDYLSRKPDIEVVGRITDGAAVCPAVAEHLPDVIVMELILPRCDGFMVLDQLAKLPAGNRPRAIVLTSLSRDDLILRAVRSGAAYYMVKPFDMQLLYERIREIAQGRETAALEIRDADASDAAADEQITNLFLTLGIPAHIKGYQYLREAVRMVMLDRSLTGRITKELYPGVAQRFNTTASKVERAMRHAIEVAWNRGRLEAANRMYGLRVFEKMDKPTNGEFISCVAEKIITRKSA